MYFIRCVKKRFFLNDSNVHSSFKVVKIFLKINKYFSLCITCKNVQTLLVRIENKFIVTQILLYFDCYKFAVFMTSSYVVNLNINITSDKNNILTHNPKFITQILLISIIRLMNFLIHTESKLLERLKVFKIKLSGLKKLWQGREDHEIWHFTKVTTIIKQIFKLIFRKC